MLQWKRIDSLLDDVFSPRRSVEDLRGRTPWSDKSFEFLPQPRLSHSSQAGGRGTALGQLLSSGQGVGRALQGSETPVGSAMWAPPRTAGAVGGGQPPSLCAFPALRGCERSLAQPPPLLDSESVTTLCLNCGVSTRYLLDTAGPELPAPPPLASDGFGAAGLAGVRRRVKPPGPGCS